MTPLNAAQMARAQQIHRLLGSGGLAQAVTQARALAQEAPAAPDAQQLLGICLGQAGDGVGAEAALRRALQLAPGQPNVLANYATLLRKLGRHAEALECWQQVTRSLPTQPAAWLELGLCALTLGRASQAQSALQRATELQPGNARAWHGLGNARRAINDLAGADAALRHSLDLQPGNARAWATLGGVQRMLGRPQQALVSYQQARQHGGEGPELSDAEIGARVEVGQLTEATAQAQQLTREYPDYVPGHVTRANIQWEYGERGDGAEDPLNAFRGAADARPEHGELQLAYVSFLLEAKRCEEALQRLAQLRGREDHPLLVTLQANALELLDRPDQAAPLYAQAHRDWGRDNPSFLNAYVRHLLKAGQWDRAAELSRHAVDIDPDNQESWAYLATAWRLLGDEREHWLCDYEQLVALVEVQPPPGYASMAEFLDALMATLDRLHQATTEPVRQSLRGGSQTSGRLFGRPEPEIVAVEQALLRAIEGRIASLPVNPEHPYLRRRQRSVSFSGSWSVKLWSSGNHVNHFHSEGWMSSAFYVALPPTVRQAAEDDHAGHIQFGQPPVELGLNLPPRRVIRPQLGHLALFPSYLWHGTVPFVDEHPRVTIAFDMLPKA
ncbi:MAG: tetratricopeptide repeat protein [Lysobacterales bacterium]